MKVVYQGISKEQRKRILDGHAQSINPCGAADGYLYTVEQNDHPMVVQRKNEATKAWKDARIAERSAEIDELDSHKLVEGIDFPKGKAIDVPEDHPALKTVNFNGDVVDGPLCGYIKARWFKVLDDAGEEIPQKLAPKKDKK